MITPDPENRFVLATDLGQDRIYSYRFDAATGKLCPPSCIVVKLPEGDGPRHLAFHPNGKWLYSIQEEASTVALFQYDSSSGALTAEQSVSTLPPGFAGTSFASEILIAPNGRFLYAANRLHDTIAAFAIQAGGSWRVSARPRRWATILRNAPSIPAEGSSMRATGTATASPVFASTHLPGCRSSPADTRRLEARLASHSGQPPPSNHLSAPKCACDRITRVRRTLARASMSTIPQLIGASVHSALPKRGYLERFECAACPWRDDR